MRSRESVLEKLLPNVNKDLVSLVKRMLEFNPYFRIKASDALKNKAFDSIRVPHYEQPCSKKIVIKGYLESNFDYETLTSQKFKSTQSLLKVIAKEKLKVQKYSVLYELD